METIINTLSALRQLKHDTPALREPERWDNDKALLLRYPAPYYIGERQHLQKVYRARLVEPFLDIYASRFTERLDRLFDITGEQYKRILVSKFHDKELYTEKAVRRKLHNYVDDEDLLSALPAVLESVTSQSPLLYFCGNNSDQPLKLGLPTTNLWFSNQMPVLLTDMNPAGDEFMEFQIGQHRMSAVRALHSIEARTRIQNDPRFPEPNRRLAQIPIVYTNMVRGLDKLWYVDMWSMATTPPQSGIWRPRHDQCSIIPGKRGIYWAFGQHSGYLKLFTHYASIQEGFAVFKMMLDCFRVVKIIGSSKLHRDRRTWMMMRKFLIRAAAEGRTIIQWLNKRERNALQQIGFFETGLQARQRLQMILGLPANDPDITNVEYWLPGHSYKKTSYHINARQFKRLSL